MVYGDGQQSRCFLHVNDAVEALIGLVQSADTVGQVFNVGSTEEISIFELARKVVRYTTGSSTVDDNDIAFVPYEQAFEAGFEDMRRRVPSIAKIRQYIGWDPKYTLDDTLRDIIAHSMHESVVMTK
jgi:UDP-glucose 4-epimerase